MREKLEKTWEGWVVETHDSYSWDDETSYNPHDPFMQWEKLELGFEDWTQDNEKREFLS